VREARCMLGSVQLGCCNLLQDLVSDLPEENRDQAIPRSHPDWAICLCYLEESVSPEDPGNSLKAPVSQCASTPNWLLR
jgi:hypothetical protein